MSIKKKIVFGCLFVLVGIQFIPTTRNQNSNVLPTDFMNTFNVPIEFRQMIKTSCYDCHSNNTKYPWYNKFQPVSWLLENHIKEAKAELNFSEFGEYSKRRQRSKLKSIINQIKEDEMPLFAYKLMHPKAKISEEGKSELLEWLSSLRESL